MIPSPPSRPEIRGDNSGDSYTVTTKDDAARDYRNKLVFESGNAGGSREPSLGLQGLFPNFGVVPQGPNSLSNWIVTPAYGRDDSGNLIPTEPAPSRSLYSPSFPSSGVAAAPETRPVAGPNSSVTPGNGIMSGTGFDAGGPSDTDNSDQENESPWAQVIREMWEKYMRSANSPPTIQSTGIDNPPEVDRAEGRNTWIMPGNGVLGGMTLGTVRGEDSVGFGQPAIPAGLNRWDMPRSGILSGVRLGPNDGLDVGPSDQGNESLWAQAVREAWESRLQRD